MKNVLFLDKKEEEFLESIGIMVQVRLVLESKELEDSYKKSQILEIIDNKLGELQQSEFDVLKSEEFLNPHKLTMIDAVQMHKNLSKMVDNGCEVVIIEVSSQGLEQNRHWGLARFEYGVFLNLYPEHIESHGSFENYKLAKAKLFERVRTDGFVFANGDDPHSEEMLNFAPITTTKVMIKSGVDYKIASISNYIFKDFEFGNTKIMSNFVADFEVQNAVIASSIVSHYIRSNHGITFDKELLGGNFFQIPGRMEWVILDNKIV